MLGIQPNPLLPEEPCPGTAEDVNTGERWPCPQGAGSPQWRGQGRNTLKCVQRASEKSRGRARSSAEGQRRPGEDGRFSLPLDSVQWGWHGVSVSEKYE